MNIIDYRKLSHKERAALEGRVRRVYCGPECECDTPKTGISIGRLDSFGDPYPDAVGVILDKGTNEWVVYVRDDEHGQREAARYPAAEVDAIRYLPNETRTYAHWVPDEAAS
jgi:hypothetical protein